MLPILECRLVKVEKNSLFELNEVYQNKPVIGNGWLSIRSAKASLASFPFDKEYPIWFKSHD